jgi:hypothetical protein
MVRGNGKYLCHASARSRMTYNTAFSIGGMNAERRRIGG